MKTERLIIRITPEQKTQIKNLADKAGKSLSQHVIDSALTPQSNVRTTTTQNVRTEPGARTKGNAIADFFNRDRE